MEKKFRTIQSGPQTQPVRKVGVRVSPSLRVGSGVRVSVSPSSRVGSGVQTRTIQPERYG